MRYRIPTGIRPVNHTNFDLYKMHVPRFLLLLLILPVLMVAGCTNDELDEPMTRPEPEPPLESITLTFDHPDCQIRKEPCVHLYFHYPVYSGSTPLSDSLRIWTERQLFYPEPGAIPTIADSLAKEWFRDYDRYAQQIQGYNLSWSLERSIEQIFESETLVTLHFHEFSFSGGAHPQQLDLFRSFIKPQGKQITLADLTYDYRAFEQLVALTEEHFRFSFELLESENLTDAGFHFLDGQFHLTENFAFTEYGLLFYFNAYEVAPYATGPIAIELPYEDLEYLIRSRWLYQRTRLAL